MTVGLKSKTLSPPAANADGRARALVLRGTVEAIPKKTRKERNISTYRARKVTRKVSGIQSPRSVEILLPKMTAATILGSPSMTWAPKGV